VDDERVSEFWLRVSARHGLLTRAEGVAAFGERGFKARVAEGQFIRIHMGIYRVAGAPITTRQHVLGINLALDSVSGLRSAAALRDVGGYTLDRPEFLRPTRSNFKRRFDFQVRAHRTNFLPPHHIELVDEIPTTTMARTLCDLSSVVSVERLARVLDESKRRGLVDYPEIAKCREELRARGRRRTTFLDQVLETRVAGYDPGESPPEHVVRVWLEDAGFNPVVQHRVVINGERRRLDLALVDDMIAIEYQGIDAHSTLGAVVEDSRKVTELQLAGWLVLLVTKKTTKVEFLRQLRDFVALRHA